MSGASITKMSVITGGGLGGDVWVPRELKLIDGVEYLPVSLTDRKFMKFVGVDLSKSAPLACNPFMHTLRQARNDAMDIVIAEYIRKSDPLASATSKAVTAARRTLDPSVMDPWCMASLPAIADIRCASELQRNRMVYVELQDGAMNYLRVAVLDAQRSSDDENVRKRSAPIGVKGARVDKRRGTVYMTIAALDDPTAKRKRVQRKLSSFMTCEIHAAAEELVNDTLGETGCEDKDGDVGENGGEDDALEDAVQEQEHEQGDEQQHESDDTHELQETVQEQEHEHVDEQNHEQ